MRLAERTLAIAVAVLLAMPAAAEPVQPRIVELRADWRGDELFVGYRVVDGFTEESLERARSGMPFTIRHSLELVAKWIVPLWPSQTLDAVRVDSTAIHDSLTRTYQLERRWVRRHRGESPIENREARSGATEAEMRAWIQEFPDIVLCSREELPERGATLRAESVLGRRWIWYVVPGSRRVDLTRRIER